MRSYDGVELVLLPARARKFNKQVYMAAIAVAGSEKEVFPQILVYSSDAVILKTLVESHNRLVRESRKEETSGE